MHHKSKYIYIYIYIYIYTHTYIYTYTYTYISEMLTQNRSVLAKNNLHIPYGVHFLFDMRSLIMHHESGMTARSLDRTSNLDQAPSQA